MGKADRALLPSVPGQQVRTKGDLRRARAYLRSENKDWPAELVELEEERWPSFGDLKTRFKVWRSRTLVVQAFKLQAGIVRLSVARCEFDDLGRFRDGLSWDDLQRVKRECGYGDMDAVEVYPVDNDIVNVANMRHLWIMPEGVNFAWRNKAAHEGH